MEILVKKIARQCGLTACTASLILSMLISSCSQTARPAVPYYTDASFTPLWDLSATKTGKDHRVGNFNLTNQHGQQFGSKDVSGKIYLANFFFTSCKAICPKMLINMKTVSDHFSGNKNVLFLSHSVTPEMDSVSVLFDYAERNNISNPQWHLLTGNVNDIYWMARTQYFVEEAEGLSKDSSEFLHTENIVLVDRDGHLRGLYNGTIASEVPRIIDDMDALLKEK